MLQRQVFYPDNPMGVSEGRTPPLASLLPQLKLIALRLVPREGSGVTSRASYWRTAEQNVQEIVEPL